MKKQEIKDAIIFIKDEATYCDLQVNVMDKKLFLKRINNIINKCKAVLSSIDEVKT
jgi:hypothetical protein